ncbi:MAG: CHAT domain-containing protein [Anaerolineae bacterium]|nr:CHAT domain-containing protein [Anaerolineae bacterium]
MDNKAVALQQAMQAVSSNPEFSHPRYWAPFVAVGAEA